MWHQILHSSRSLADAIEADTRYFFKMERHPIDPNPEAINRLSVWRRLAEDDDEDLPSDNRQLVSYIKYDMATGQCERPKSYPPVIVWREKEQNELVLTGDKADPALPVIGTSMPNLDLNAESTYRQIKQFLRSCDVNHASCNKIRIHNDHV